MGTAEADKSLLPVLQAPLGVLGEIAVVNPTMPRSQARTFSRLLAGAIVARKPGRWHSHWNRKEEQSLESHHSSLPGWPKRVGASCANRHYHLRHVAFGRSCRKGTEPGRIQNIGMAFPMGYRGTGTERIDSEVEERELYYLDLGGSSHWR
jgi:hypothetical protein